MREPENIKLVRAGGADEVVSPPRFGGFLMADAVGAHGTVDFVSELLSYRGNYQLVEREVRLERQRGVNAAIHVVRASIAPAAKEKAPLSRGRGHS